MDKQITIWCNKCGATFMGCNPDLLKPKDVPMTCSRCGNRMRQKREPKTNQPRRATIKTEERKR